MGLFDRFKSRSTGSNPSEPITSAASKELDEATRHYTNGDYTEALRQLAAGFQKDIDNLKLYELAAQTLEQMGGKEEARLFRNVQRQGTKIYEPFRELGMHFYSESHYELARCFLQRAVDLNPSDGDVVHDLALVLARRFRIKEALAAFEENNALEGFWNYWFWCKLRILSGQTEGVEEGLKQLLEILDAEPEQERVAIARMKVEEVMESLQRYRLLESPQMDIQHWHFIQYGSVILDYFDDTEDYVAGGRYVASWGSNQSIREVIQKLSKHMENASYVVDRVVALPDRNAQILGETIARYFGKQMEIYHPEMDTRNALVVAGNSDDFDGLQDFGHIADGQLLFALNHNWLRNAHVTPDVVGFMNQSYTFPWEGGGIRIVDMETRQTERTLPDEREPEYIAEEILREELGTEYKEQRLEFYSHYKEWLKASGSNSNKVRFNFMMESPVPGSFFA